MFLLTVWSYLYIQEEKEMINTVIGRSKDE